MKKSIVALACPLIISLQSTAQDQLRHHELTAGYGTLSTNEIIGTFSDFLATGITGGNYSKTDNRWLGNLILSYKFTPINKLEVGLTYVYNRNTATINSNNVPSGKATTTYHTLAAEVQYNYINKPFFRLYSAAGAGFTTYMERYNPKVGNTEKNTSGNFNFQISPIGIKFGDHIGAMAELGFGYKGIINAGLFVRI